MDSNRLSEIYAQHSLEAVRLAYMLTGDRAVAEDIVHEAFVRMVGRFKDRRGPEVAQAYLRQAVLNVTKNYFRRLKVERSHLHRESSILTPAHDTGEAESRDELRRALLALPLRQRTALVLRYFLDLSEQQVADTLGCTKSAAKSILYRGLESMRKEVGSEKQ